MKTLNFNRILYKLKVQLRRDVPRGLVLTGDLYATVTTFLIIYGLQSILDNRADLTFNEVLIYEVPQVVICALAAFFISSSYKSIIRHTGLKDIGTVFYANFLYAVFMFALLLTAVQLQLPSYFLIGKKVILVHLVLNSLALISLRIIYKTIYYKYIVDNSNLRKKTVMIYGAGNSGVITYNALLRDKGGLLKVLGFIDDKTEKQGKKIDGIRIFSPAAVTSEFIRKNKIDEIIISIQNIATARLREIVNDFEGSGVSLKIVPAVSDWIDGSLTEQQIKPVRVEDLLGRKAIELEKESIISEISGKSVMVTGAAGSIGSEISRQLMKYSPARLVLIDQAESPLYDLQQSEKGSYGENCYFAVGDIRNRKTISQLMNIHRPDIVFHAAAYKHVPLMEESPYQAVQTNVKGTKIVADAALEYGVSKFVMVSTDKAVNPTNIMGATKRVAELYVSSLNQYGRTNYIVTRFGNVLGSNGSVIPLFERQIRTGGPLTVTHPDITRYFMTIPEACQLVLEAGAMARNGEIFVFDMGKPVRIFDLAKKIIQLSGFRYPQDIDIKIVGLRPGEKIYEELLANDENTVKTHHPKIMIAKVRPPEAEFEMLLNELITAERSESDPEKSNLELVTLLKKIVPEYISQNSIYSVIDQKIKHQNSSARLTESLKTFH